MIILAHSVGALLYVALPYVNTLGYMEKGVTAEIAVGSWLVAFTMGYVVNFVISLRSTSNSIIFTLVKS